jgi:hypothetical protein
MPFPPYQGLMIEFWSFLNEDIADELPDLMVAGVLIDLKQLLTLTVEAPIDMALASDSRFFSAIYSSA